MDFGYSSFFDVEGFEHRALFEDTKRVWDVLAKLDAFLATLRGQHIRGSVSAGAWLEGEGIVISKGARVEPGAYIRGPALIGEDAEVRHGAYLRGRVIVGRGAVVGHATEVKRSIFLDGAKAGHFAYVGDSLLGNDVNLGAGTKLANLRFDRAELHVALDGTRIATGLKKLGAVIGDGCELGCNVVTNPATLLGKGCRVMPAIAIRGCHVASSSISATSGNGHVKGGGEHGRQA